MIKTTEQALFCLLTPDVDDNEQVNYCKNCKYDTMCREVVAVISKYKKLEEKQPAAQEKEDINS